MLDKRQVNIRNVGYEPPMFKGLESEVGWAGEHGGTYQPNPEFLNSLIFWCI